MSVYVRPSDGPRGRGRGTTTRLSSRGASGRGTAGGQQHRFSQRLDDDDILMGEDPKQVLTVSLYLLINVHMYVHRCMYIGVCT